MRVIIDRFEKDFAICEKEDMTMIDISRSKLPKEAKEGDILVVEDDNIIIDVEATKVRREELEKLFNS